MSLRIEPYSELIPGYRLLERLGGGGFGEVWKAEAPGGFHKALKVIHGDIDRGSPEEMRHAEQEMRALQHIQSIRHPFLLSVERFDIVEGRLVIVMELADSDLWDRYREHANAGELGIPREELLRYMEETAEVLDVMNTQHQLQHLDVKPQNLFLLHNHIKVADFGLVKALEGSNAVVTGGVTPVYAAPETFDGNLSRSCDQYSLAIVYVELLTGERPYTGTTLKQLIAQHTEGSPDLSKLPPSDRPAVARALSKKPNDRFPTCAEFVYAIRQAGTLPARAPASGSPTPRPASAASMTRTAHETAAIPHRVPVGDHPTPGSGSLGLSRVLRPAPEELTGNGVLMPTFLIGLGRAGTDVLRRFRLKISERFGNMKNIPTIKLFSIDTDAQAMDAATLSDGPASLRSDEAFTARLNRTSYYLQARRSGRRLIEGWCSPQVLYRIPRNLTTSGLRTLGRLAFCDHYRSINKYILNSLMNCTEESAMEQAEHNTGLGLRSNRPRVYILCHLAGGTGSGMFIDVAYAVRQRLAQLGYENTELIGVFFLPPLTGGANSGVSLSNAYAALTELNHFSHHETVYTNSTDERNPQLSDYGPPFSQCIMIQSPAQSPQSDDRVALHETAQFLYRELATPFGRRADIERDRAFWDGGAGTGPRMMSFGVSSYTWPRQTAVWVAAQRLTLFLLGRWIAKKNRDVGETVESIGTEIWETHGFSPRELNERFRAVLETSLGYDPLGSIAVDVASLGGRSRFRKGPKPSAVNEQLEKLKEVLGAPDSIGLQGYEGELQQHCLATTTQLSRELGDILTEELTTLVERPGLRLLGAKQLGAVLQKLLREVSENENKRWTQQAEVAAQAYAVLTAMATPQKGRRAAPDPGEQLHHYVHSRYESLVLRQVSQLCKDLADRLQDLQRDMEFMRRRLEELHGKVNDAVSKTPRIDDAALLPEGCQSLEEVAQRAFDTLTEDDLAVLDRQIQSLIEQEFGSLYRACTGTVERLDELALLMFEKAQTFMDQRLGQADVVEMFLRRFPQADQAVAMIQKSYQNAAPTIPSQAGTEVCILGLPPGEQGEPFQLLAQRALAGIDVTPVDHSEEILLYRECPHLSPEDLPHLQSDIADLYFQAFGSDNSNPHCRSDITDWFPVETS